MLDVNITHLGGDYILQDKKSITSFYIFANLFNVKFKRKTGGISYLLLLLIYCEQFGLKYMKKTQLQAATLQEKGGES